MYQQSRYEADEIKSVQYDNPDFLLIIERRNKPSRGINKQFKDGSLKGTAG